MVWGDNCSYFNPVFLKVDDRLIVSEYRNTQKYDDFLKSKSFIGE